jgi:hypothetical protein
MLNVVMLSVILPNVVAPPKENDSVFSTKTSKTVSSSSRIQNLLSSHHSQGSQEQTLTYAINVFSLFFKIL